MKSKLSSTLFLAFVLFALVSCDESDSDMDIGGSQSPVGEVGNVIDFGPIQGLTNTNVYVSSLENGISTFSGSVTVTNSTYTDLLSSVPTEIFPGAVSIDGSKVEGTVNIKTTTDGVQLVFKDGSKLTLVDYDANVGDKYTAKVGGYTFENEVVEKSTEDDFYWGGMYIKVIKVKCKSVTPGISDYMLYYNHKYCLVGIDIIFEDGSKKLIGVEC
uniref:hypothetical protein n=1 Tax=uncultured Draconibacterium sp. TaxID=1573823 RepID=UPI0032174F2C